MLFSDIPAYAAHRKPGGVAVFFQGRSVTNAELRDRAWRLSNALLAVARGGDRVAILSENRPEYAECYYGVPGAGMTLTLINYRLSARELTYILRDSEPRILILEAKYLPVIRDIRDRIPSIEQLVLIDGIEADCTAYEHLLATGAPRPPNVRPDENSLCWLIYTSGTTGKPKGAMLSHRNLISSIMSSSMAWRFETDDVYMLTFPQFHVAGFSMPMQHLNAVPVVLLKTFDTQALMHNIGYYSVTGTAAAPTMIAMLLERPDLDSFDLGSLRQLRYGAAPMPAELLRRLRQRWPGLRMSTGYGMTELAGNATSLVPGDHDRAIDGELEILRSVGRPLPLLMTRIVDDRGHDVIGQPGEVLIKGDQVMSGYWRNSAATEAAFAGGWFRSGDVGRLDENGFLYLVDRKKDMILSGGENVYPREVEDVLFQHPAIAEAAVIGVPDAKWGESVVAVLCLREGAAVTSEEIIAFCRERIASYKKPKLVAVVAELPKNASGKVLKRELREQAAAGMLPIL